MIVRYFSVLSVGIAIYMLGAVFSGQLDWFIDWYYNHNFVGLLIFVNFCAFMWFWLALPCVLIPRTWGGLWAILSVVLYWYHF